MKALVQRAAAAHVTVVEEDGSSRICGAIDRGLLVLVGIERDDQLDQVARLADRLLAYRLFADDNGRMNRNVVEAQGGVLLVSQFTLAADTRKGLRPGFSSAAEPERARSLFDALVAAVSARHSPVATGLFGAHMQVHLINDGPVTFLLEV